jgi:hypothetical protein
LQNHIRLLKLTSLVVIVEAYRGSQESNLWWLVSGSIRIALGDLDRGWRQYCH